MTFEHYMRSGTKMLRCGYTTGTCAALAAAAAAEILLNGHAPESVSLVTANGIPVEVNPDTWGFDGTRAWASVKKYSGDDPDVTSGLLIRADVSKSGRPGIHIDGGEGVGRVTKPGLDQPVGNAAINSVPRRMITDAVAEVLNRTTPDDDIIGIDVLISVPGGEETAKKTFNPGLGIEGGISILGTTGIVEPMSEQALIDTIEVNLRMVTADSRDLIITPGSYGSHYIDKQKLFDTLNIPVVKISNFLGETLDMIAGSDVDTVLLISHVGKLVKVAAGIMNTHSRYADGRNEIFCAHAAICGAGTEICRQLMDAVTTDACIEILDHADLREPVIHSILASIQQKLDHRVSGAFKIGAVMFSNVYGLLGNTETAEKIILDWEQRAARE